MSVLKALKRIAWLGIFGSLALAATAAAGPGAPVSNDKTFTLRIQGEPETLDWNKAHTPVETYLLMNLMEGLVGLDDKLKPVPSLAQSWTVSSDGRTYTFKLRPGVKWSDGVTLRAQDFVYSWKRLLSPVTAASYAYFLFDVEGAEFFYKGAIQDFKQVGIKALDDLTFQVKLTRPVAHWLSIPTFWVTFPLREDIVEKHGNSWDTPGRMVTVGPYTLTAHDYDTKIVLKANPHYWGPRGNVDQVVALIVKDDSTALSLFEAGKLDFLTDIATLDLKRLAGNPELKTFPYLKTGYLGFVTTKYPLTNPHLRRAIAMAIDKREIPKILHGGQRPATSFVPPSVLGYSERAGLAFDPLKAKAELRLSGIDASKPLSLDMIVPNWDKPLILGQFIQSELKKHLGLNIVLQAFDNKTFRSQLDLHAFPLLEASWSADYPDPDNFLSVFLGNSGNNRTAWKSEKFDELVIAGRTATARAAREKFYREAQAILLEEQAVILPLYYEPNMALVRSRVKNLDLNPLNFLLLRKVRF